MQMKKNSKEIKKQKAIGGLGSISGIASLMGSWQVCHSICLTLISLLSIIGITLTGMPLLFMTGLAKPFWIIAFILLLITLYFYIARGCISGKLILFNS